MNISSLVSSGKKKLQNVFAQAPQVANNVFKGTQQAVGGFTSTFKPGVVDFAQGAAKNITNTPQGVYNTVAGNMSRNPTQIQQGQQQLTQARLGADQMFGSGYDQNGQFKVTGTGAPRVALTAVSALTGPAALAGNIGFGGAVGGTMAALQHKPIGTGIGQGAAQGFQYAGVNKLTSPLTNPIASRIGDVAGRVLAKDATKGTQTMMGKVGQIAGRSAGQGLANVAQHQLYTRTYEGREPTTSENIQNFIIGAGIEGFNASKDIKIGDDGYLYNKSGQMFDPFTGRFMAASNKLRQAQHDFAVMVGGNTIDFKNPGVWHQADTGLVRMPAARSRLH